MRNLAVLVLALVLGACKSSDTTSKDSGGISGVPGGPQAGVCLADLCSDVLTSGGRYMLACGDSGDYSLDPVNEIYELVSAHYTTTVDNDFTEDEVDNGLGAHVSGAFDTEVLVAIDSVVGVELGDEEESAVHFGSRTYVVASEALAEELMNGAACQ